MAESDPHNNPELSIAEIRAACANHPNSIRLQDLHKHADADQEYQQIQHYVRNGFPHHRHQLPERCRRYWNIRSQLTLDDDLIVFSCRLLIPPTMHSQILHKLHASHQGPSGQNSKPNSSSIGLESTMTSTTPSSPVSNARTAYHRIPRSQSP